MGRAVVVAGGWAHDAAPLVDAMAGLLPTHALEPVVVTNPDCLAAALGDPFDLLVVGACWFAMTDARYDDAQRRAHAVVLDTGQRTALESARADHVPLLAMHTAPICFDGWQLWRDWLGGTWNWETSWHPAPTAIDIAPAVDSPIDFERFTVTDEEYQGLDVAPDVSLVAASSAGHPLAWLRSSGSEKVAVDLLGHDERSLAEPAHGELLDRLVGWLLA